MNPVALIAFIGVAAIALSIFRTAKTAASLTWNVTRFGIYHFAVSGEMVLRVRLRIGNPMNTPITINFIDVSAYIDPTVDSQSNVLNRGSYISSVMVPGGFVIQPNAVTEQEFFINVRWVDIAKYLISNVTAIIDSFSNAESLNSVVNALLSHKFLIQGNIKAESINIPISQVVSLVDERQ